MVLRKVKKSVVYGAVLVAHYGADLADKNTASSTFSSWGDSINITPQFDDSFLEIVLTGSARVSSNMAAGTSYGRLRIMVNGQEEYMLDNLIGGYQQRSGGHNHQNTSYGENNGRQNFRIYGSGTAIYVNHLHSPGTSNEQEFQCEVATSNSLNVDFAEGFMTITELASEGYNLT